MRSTILLVLILLAACSPLAQPEAQEIMSGPAEYSLLASESAVRYVDGAYTAVYAYNHSVPGPVLRATVDQPLTVTLNNDLPVPTTIHWHGVRVPNDQDGVPGITQEAIPPGENHTYSFTPKDAGTYWYHSHQDSAEQVERGLHGPLIIDDPEDPYNAIPELILMLDDVLLDDDGQLQRFGIGVMHGRFGNTLLVNGEQRPVLAAPSEGTVRLRIINAANARTFSLEGAQFTVIGEDIGPVEEPYETTVLTVMPGQRYDALIDMHGKDALLTTRTGRSRAPLAIITPEAEPAGIYGTTELVVEEPFVVDQALRRQAPNLTVDLRGEMRDGGLAWTLDGHAHPETTAEYTLQKGGLYKVRLTNPQGQPHPMHLHGQRFRILARNGADVESGWRDMVMVSGRETVDIAFVAEESGDWVFHCHILEHADAGMLGVVSVEE